MIVGLSALSEVKGYAVRRFPTSFRLSEECLAILKDHEERMGITKSAVIELAMRVFNEQTQRGTSFSSPSIASDKTEELPEPQPPPIKTPKRK